MEHGHALLLRAISERRPEWLGRTGLRLLEVGSTREPHPGQDSTRVLAEFCRDHGWDFVTCDMDPLNSERATALFAELGVPFTAVTDRGEDYIAAQRDAFDVVYLDAYDFDHGMHSEVRQERYEQILGSRIDQIECEKMHLRAVRGLNRAGRGACLCVIDDTWRDEDGTWQGKGPRAVPWALRNGWTLTIEDPDTRAVALEFDPAWNRFDRRASRSLRRRARKLRKRLSG